MILSYVTLFIAVWFFLRHPVVTWHDELNLSVEVFLIS